MESAWLWLSWQRYALLLAALALLPSLLVGLVAPTLWWAWLIAAPITARVGAFAVMVWRRWPSKRHALRVALFRIAAGRFEPAQVRRHCGDPCFRLVAHACLRRAGFAAAQRRRIVAAHAASLRDERSELIVIDHVRGEVHRTTGGRTRVDRFLDSPSGDDPLFKSSESAQTI
jgi:hypothetical protein